MLCNKREARKAAYHFYQRLHGVDKKGRVWYPASHLLRIGLVNKYKGFISWLMQCKAQKRTQNPGSMFTGIREINALYVASSLFEVAFSSIAFPSRFASEDWKNKTVRRLSIRQMILEGLKTRVAHSRYTLGSLQTNSLLERAFAQWRMWLLALDTTCQLRRQIRNQRFYDCLQ